MSDINNNMGWDISAVKNERTRPEGQSIFDWLLEDKELIHETDKDIRLAGYKWFSAII